MKYKHCGLLSRNGLYRHFFFFGLFLVLVLSFFYVLLLFQRENGRFYFRMPLPRCRRGTAMLYCTHPQDADVRRAEVVRDAPQPDRGGGCAAAVRRGRLGRFGRGCWRPVGLQQAPQGGRGHGPAPYGKVRPHYCLGGWLVVATSKVVPTSVLVHTNALTQGIVQFDLRGPWSKF